MLYCSEHVAEFVILSAPAPSGQTSEKNFSNDKSTTYVEVLWEHAAQFVILSMLPICHPEHAFYAKDLIERFEAFK